MWILIFKETRTKTQVKQFKSKDDLLLFVEENNLRDNKSVQIFPPDAAMTLQDAEGIRIRITQYTESGQCETRPNFDIEFRSKREALREMCELADDEIRRQMRITRNPHIHFSKSLNNIACEVYVTKKDTQNNTPVQIISKYHLNQNT